MSSLIKDLYAIEEATKQLFSISTNWLLFLGQKTIGLLSSLSQKVESRIVNFEKAVSNNCFA